MVRLLNSITFSECLVTNVIEIFNSGWEPWYFRRTYLCNSLANEVKLADRFLHIGVGGVAFDVNKEINLSPIVLDEF